jgi:hypothetical protein
MLQFFLDSMPGILAALAIAPLVLVIVLGWLPWEMPYSGRMLSGNALLENNDADASTPSPSAPLVHLVRSSKLHELRSAALGQRFFPIARTAEFLKRCAGKEDVELQLYAQTVMADGQDKLQSVFLRLLPDALPDAPATSASFISAGMNLLDSPLTPDSERPSIIGKMLPVVDRLPGSGEIHPRLLFEGARLMVLLHRMIDAEKLHQRLPAGSPLYEKLAQVLAHQRGVLTAQGLMSPGDEVS